MIRASFTTQGGLFCGFRVMGHAGFGQYGQDIVCAAVTSAVQLTANAVTDTLMRKATVNVLDNEINLALDKPDVVADQFIRALKDHLGFLAEDYPGTIEINTEV